MTLGLGWKYCMKKINHTLLVNVKFILFKTNII